MSNQDIANLFRSVATALSIKKASIFEVRAYETAADAIEHLTTDLRDLWEEDKLDQIPGLGKSLRGYIDELFKTGKVKHFENLKKDIPSVVFELIDVPGIGPKTAQELAGLGIKSIEDLEKRIKSGQLVTEGFSAKIAEKIARGILEYKSLSTNRILLPIAVSLAQKVLDYLKKCSDVIQVVPLGSLRRWVATVGDLDFAASSKNPQKVTEWLTKMPGVSVVNKGENKATVILSSGLHVDLLVGEPESYGALLQHFTGSKAHNIKLRTFANQKGFTLSEYGVKRIKNHESRIKEKTIKTETEKELYKLLGMQSPPPEIREDTGEIEAALAHKLPKLVELKDIRGDLHLHSNFPIESPSHGPGANFPEEIVEYAVKLGYQYVGISDHPPSFYLPKNRIIEILKRRNESIAKLKSKKSIRVLNGLEIDILPDGSLSVPD